MEVPLKFERISNAYIILINGKLISAQCVINLTIQEREQNKTLSKRGIYFSILVGYWKNKYKFHKPNVNWGLLIISKTKFFVPTVTTIKAD